MNLNSKSLIGFKYEEAKIRTKASHPSGKTVTKYTHSIRLSLTKNGPQGKLLDPSLTDLDFVSALIDFERREIPDSSSSNFPVSPQGSREEAKKQL
jgi:hypothetical protein